MKSSLRRIRETRPSAGRMKYKVDRVTKARDIEDGRCGDVDLDSDKANFLAEFLASGKKAVSNGDFAEPGQEVFVRFSFFNGNTVIHEYSWREYNRAVAAFKAGRLPKNGAIVQLTSPPPEHKPVWYKPSTWF